MQLEFPKANSDLRLNMQNIQQEVPWNQTLPNGGKEAGLGRTEAPSRPNNSSSGPHWDPRAAMTHHSGPSEAAAAWPLSPCFDRSVNIVLSLQGVPWVQVAFCSEAMPSTGR